jgi:hypothetical protein
MRRFLLAQAFLATATSSALQDVATVEQLCNETQKVLPKDTTVSLLQHSSVKQVIQRHNALSDVQCGGRTLPGNTAWQQFYTDGIYVDVDTSQCAFKATPVYVSSMGGKTNQWKSTGSSEIYFATPKGFRIYISYPGITTSLANKFGWNIIWIGSGSAAQKPATHLCSGKTEIGSTSWREFGSDGLYVDVDTSKCGFSIPPNYISSLGGKSHWTTTGSSEIYEPRETGFRVYISNKEHIRQGVRAIEANRLNWHINWVAEGVGIQKVVAAPCSGMSTPGSTNWKQFSENGIYLDVDTSACDLKETPDYVTSLSGKNQHWKSTGSSEIYAATPTGFRVYIHFEGVTPSKANSWNWHMNWIASVTADVTPKNKVQCGGSTLQGSTAWQYFSKDGIYVDVDTSQCAFTATPEYVSSMGGKTNQWKSTGSSEIYQASPKGFRIYAHYPGITAAKANKFGWHINWIGSGSAAKKPTTYLCSGHTTVGSTRWSQFYKDGLYVDVDTSKCAFSTAPKYVSSIGGVTNHWHTTGSSEIYQPTASGFRIYIHNPVPITASVANSRKWHINWIAEGVGSDPLLPAPCSGHTSKGQTSWQKFYNDGIYVDVDTSACGFTVTPNYATSLLGISHHWMTSGSSEIYFATPTSFRVYIKPLFKGGITPEQANTWQWRLNWMAVVDQLPTPNPTPRPTAVPMITTVAPTTCDECLLDFSKLAYNPLGNDNTFVKYNETQTLQFKRACSVAGKDLDLRMEIAPGYETKPTRNKAGHMYVFNVKVATSASVKFTMLHAGQPIEVGRILFSVLDLDLGHYGTQWISTSGFSESKKGNGVLQTIENGETKFEALRHGTATDNPTDPARLRPEAFSSALALLYKSTSEWTVKLGVTGDDHNSSRNFYLAGSTQLWDATC